MSRGSLRPFTRGREILSHAIADYKGQVQNVKAARVYIFGDDDIVEDDENDQTEFEMPEIRSRRGQQGIGSGGRLEEEKFYFEKEIVDGETLQSVSLKYACPVSKNTHALCVETLKEFKVIVVEFMCICVTTWGFKNPLSLSGSIQTIKEFVSAVFILSPPKLIDHIHERIDNLSGDT